MLGWNAEDWMGRHQTSIRGRGRDMVQFSMATSISNHWVEWNHAQHAAAVLVPCSSRKSVRPQQESTAVSLPEAKRSDIETAWQDRLKVLPPIRQAGSLYAGRGMQLA